MSPLEHHISLYRGLWTSVGAKAECPLCRTAIKENPLTVIQFKELLGIHTELIEALRRSPIAGEFEVVGASEGASEGGEGAAGWSVFEFTHWPS